MWSKDKNHIDKERLDRFGEELLHAFEVTNQEVSAAANSPFLYSRIRARIEAEQRRQETERNPWFTILADVKHAIPVFAMIAVVTMGVVFASPFVLDQTPPRSQNAQSLIIINDELPAFSSDEMIASFVGWNDSQANQLKEQR